MISVDSCSSPELPDPFYFLSTFSYSFSVRISVSLPSPKLQSQCVSFCHCFPLSCGLSLSFHTSCLFPCHSYPFNLSFLWASPGCLCPAVFTSSCLNFFTLSHNIRCCSLSICTWTAFCLCFWPELLGKGSLRSRIRPQQRQMKSNKSVV